VIVSVADLYAETMQMTSNTIDRAYLGRLNVEHWSTGMQRALDFRDASNDDRFFDLDFRTVQKIRLDRCTDSTNGWASRSPQSLRQACSGGGKPRQPPRGEHPS